MHSEAWGDPREHRGGHRMRMRNARRPWTWPRSVGRRAVRVRDARRAVRAAEVRRPGGRGFRRRRTCGPAILDLLAEGQPWNGYQIIQEIGARAPRASGGPSAGVGVPGRCSSWEDEALVRAEAGEDRRRMYTLTEEGRAVRRGARRRGSRRPGTP